MRDIGVGVGVGHDSAMRLGATLRCDGCRTGIDPSGPGVTKSANTDAWWQPFLEDLRSDLAQHRHPRCFAEAFGVDALVNAVHREDMRRR